MTGETNGWAVPLVGAEREFMQAAFDRDLSKVRLVA